MQQYISPEDLRNLIAFAEDDKAPVDAQAIKGLCELHAAVERNLLKRFTGSQRRNELLSGRLERIQDKERTKLLTGEFAESGLDSLEVANALLYQLQKLKTWKLGKPKVIHILYEMYASWLYSKKERLFIEHPVATEWGPMFWRVFKRIDTRSPVPYGAWRLLCEKNPGVAAFCENAAKKYYDYADGTLNEIFVKTKAFKLSSKENNGGKWNKEISDMEIYDWKSRQAAK